MDRHTVLLDTDIGDDIDDAFALALLLRCPEVASLRVSVCFGDLTRRLRPALALVEAAAREGVGPKVTAGFGTTGTLETRPLPPSYGRSYNYENGPADVGAPVPAPFGRDADVIFSVGPMTGFGLATALDPAGLRRAKVLAMAGEFQVQGFVEHNVKCDPEAAHHAFASGVAVDVIPWSIGPATELRPQDVRRLEDAADRSPLAAAVHAELREFARHVPNKTHMFDPMAVVAWLHPEWFDWRVGRVTVELDDPDKRGLTRLDEDAAGPHRVAFGVDVERARGFLIDRLCGTA